MAENKNFSSALEEMKSRAPDIYDSIVLLYGPGELASLANDESAFNNFSAQFNNELEKRSKAEDVFADAADENPAPAEDVPPAETELDSEQEQLATDPYQWTSFYAPSPAEEARRFDESYALLDSEKGKEHQQTDAWKSSNARISEDASVDDLLTISACRRMASLNEEINLQNLTEARTEERNRIEVEYYNSLYALSLGDKYNDIKTETHLERILKIDQAVRSNKDEAEILKMLSINPKDATKNAALTVVTRSNLQPISDFVKSRTSVVKRKMHSFGKAMDWAQKFETTHPMFGFGLNMVAAGNPVYMGYRAVLSSRAIYNDVQGFKDYAAFREVFKDNVSELGFKRYQEQNPESNVDLNSYSQVKKYKTYAEYTETHKVEANRISEEEFKSLQKFQKKSEFNRAEFETLRQFSGRPYADYQKQAGNNAVSEDMFNNVVKYADVRRAVNYAEYAKKNGERAVSESEYNRVKTMNLALAKVSAWKALTDKKTLKDIASHSVILLRAAPVIAQGYALTMATKKMVKKSYWQGLGAKALASGKSVQTLWSKRGKDKEAWKDLYRNTRDIALEGAGVWMLGSGAYHTSQAGVAAYADMQENNRTLGEQAAIETKQSLQNTVNTYRNFPENAANGISNMWSKVQQFAGYGGAEVVAEAAPETPKTQTLNNVAAKDSTILDMNNQNQATQLGNTGDIFKDTQSQYSAASDSAVADVDQGTEHTQHQQTTENAKTTEQTETSAAETIVTPEISLSDEQKQNLSGLFEMYPRAATIILEGNENPSFNDVTHGSFKVDGEGNPYHNGVISSSQLRTLFEEGKLSNDQIEALNKFAGEHFKNGQPSEELVAMLNTEASREPTEKSSAEVGEKTGNSSEQNTAAVNTENSQPDNKTTTPNETTTVVEGKNPATPVENQTTENKEPNILVDSPAERDTPGIGLTRHDFESGKGYEMSGVGEQNGKTVEVVSLFNNDNKMLSSQYSVHHEDGTSTVIKTILNEEGARETVVTEINGDKYTTRSVENSREVLMAALGSEYTANNQANPLVGEHTSSSSLEDSKEIKLDGANGKSSDSQNREVTDDLYAPANQETVPEHKVWSTTFKGTYHIETGADGNPQLECALAPRQTQYVNREIVSVLQGTIEVNDDNSSKRYEALNGALHADNFGAEHRDNPNASGIMVKCEELAKQLTVNEAVYHDMDVRAGKGEDLTAQELQWRQNYQQDLCKIGLVHGENGNLVHNPEAAATLATQLDRTAVMHQGEELKDQKPVTEVYKGEENKASSETKPTNVADNSKENTVAANEDKQKTTPESENKEKAEDTAVLPQENPNVSSGEINTSGFKGTYRITDDGQGFNIASSGSVTVDQKVLQAIRGDSVIGMKQDADGKYTAANGTIKSENYSIVQAKTMMTAQAITRDEAIYDHLQEQSGTRELTNGEAKFMQHHDKHLEKLGLKHDVNGQIIKENAYDNQPRAAARRGGSERS